MHRQSEINLLNINISSRCPHFGPLTAEIGLRVGEPRQISMGFASCFRYSCDVAHRRPTKLCAMFGRLLDWYTIYIFFRSCCPLTEFCDVQKFTFASTSCVLLYWQRYCTAFKQWASAKFCGVAQGMELRNFRCSSFSTEGTTYIPREAITLSIGPHYSFYSYCVSSAEKQWCF